MQSFLNKPSAILQSSKRLNTSKTSRDGSATHLTVRKESLSTSSHEPRSSDKKIYVPSPMATNMDVYVLDESPG